MTRPGGFAGGLPFRQGPHVASLAALCKAQSIKGQDRRCDTSGTLQRSNQGIDLTTKLKSPQGADGALAGFTFFVAKGLHQLRLAPFAGLGNFDEHGAKCSALWLN